MFEPGDLTVYNGLAGHKLGIVVWLVRSIDKRLNRIDFIVHYIFVYFRFQIVRIIYV